jgi:predicted GTPase
MLINSCCKSDFYFKKYISRGIHGGSKSDDCSTPVISVINMKGGVGKTTISAHLFRHMVNCLSKTILLVDFDRSLI